MNYRITARYIAYLLAIEAGFLLIPAVIGFVGAEHRAAFSLLAAAAICGVLGLVLWFVGRGGGRAIYARESFVVAGGGWLLVSLLGALPFYFSGEIPSYVDAFFESASGFTTTGASVLSDVEALSNCLLFWRSFTHWIGGIGVLAFVLALVRLHSGSGFTLHLLRAETPGPQVGKINPKTRNSVQLLLLVYGLLSLVNLLFLLAGGMPPLEAFCTMFGTAGTGGFGIKNDSMASYTPYLQTVTTVFMALFGVNFSLYYLVARGQWRAALKDEELRLYLGVMLGSIALVTAAVVLSNTLLLGQGLHHSAFTVSSVMTTTGFSTADFNLWPEFARALLLVLMFFGAMAGSTGGGFKMARALLLLKVLRAGTRRLLHPRSVKTVHLNKKPVDNEVISRSLLYLVIYSILTLAVFLLVSLDGFSLETNFSATVSCINNIGPGLGAVGPSANYGIYSDLSKIILSFAMLLGRLEIFPILLLFFPSTWRIKT